MFDPQTLADILSRFPSAGIDTLPDQASRDGLINDTYVGERVVLQRLHPLFGAPVNRDIRALIAALKPARVPVPRIHDSDSGEPFVEVATGGPLDGVWRVLDRLPGVTIHRLERPAQAAQLGAALAQFHSALTSVDHRFEFTRPGAHDTERHLAVLRSALAEHEEHRLHGAVAELSKALHAGWEAWGSIPSLPTRIVHGDPKISNFLFAEDRERIVGVIDLDTVAHSTLDLEVGDALRSWCSTTDENAPEPDFDRRAYDRAIEGYRGVADGWLTETEVASFPRAMERICLELSARFAADALNESYFGWDPTLAETRGEHNLLRARNQAKLAERARAGLREVLR